MKLFLHLYSLAYLLVVVNANPAFAIIKESALSYVSGFGFPCLVCSTINEGSVSITCWRTTALALCPLGTLIPQNYLAVVAAMYSGLILK